MANEGLNEMRARASNIPNEDRTSSTNGYKPAIRREAAASGINSGYMELSYNYFRIRASNSNKCPTA